MEKPTKVKLTKSEIQQLLIDETLSLTDLIDAVIEVNGIIGVGLITLADDMSDYIRGQSK
jgi:hypothetical protein